jgi:hypothetical protein
MATFVLNETYVIETCYKCGIRFGISRDLYNDCQQRGPGREFFCPNGHGQVYKRSEAQKLKEELATVKNSLIWAREDRDRKARDAEYQKRRAAGARGLVTKLKNKAAKGECPCCGETFPDLHAHIQTAHPDFVKHKDDADVLEGESEREISLDKPLTEQVVTKPLIHARPTGKHAQCPHCDKWYRNKTTLKAHVARMHP